VSVERVGVAGAGTMGAGIAQLACLGDFETYLHDPDPAALEAGSGRLRAGLEKGVERGMWSAADAEAAAANLRTALRLEDLAECDLVIEAAPERLEVKHELFGRLTEICREDTVLATNTSSLPVAGIAGPLAGPERVVGMHFFNPPVLMKLVEIVAGAESSPVALDAATEAARRMGRTPVRAADEPGFLANRLVRPYSLEALRMLGDRIASHEQIDRICRVGGGFRMGPFELMDLVGIDVNFDVAKSFWEQSFHEPRWQPSPIQARMVAAGRLGRKSGRGFYDYDGGPHRPEDPEIGAPPPADVLAWSGDDAVELALETQVAVLSRIVCQLVNEACFALQRGVGSAEDIDTAMRLGFNWPRGPLEWGDEIGPERVLTILDGLRSELGEERYRAAPLLRRSVAGERALR
jgi:3-hydroxybutyryl-CoA dehydrogenase